MKKLVIVKSVRLHPSRENKYLAGREVVKKKRSFYGQDNCKGMTLLIKEEIVFEYGK